MASTSSSTFSKGENIDYELCNVDFLKENEMKDVTVKINDKEYKILLTKYQNEYFAIGNKCSHYSLPLASGFLFKGRVRCFAHGACFSVKTGDIEDFPGHDCLPSYKVYKNQTTNKIHLLTSLSELEGKFRIKKANDILKPRPSSALNNVKSEVNSDSNSIHRSNSQNDSKKFIVIGSGAAALECVETLREEGYSKNVTILTSESYPPYDRPKLSKVFDIDVDKICLRNEDFYKENQINFLKNHAVKKIHVDKHLVECDNGKIFNYDKLVIATGLIPTNHKPVAGADLNGIFTLRSYDDAAYILKYLKELKSKKDNINVLIIGTSFVALESATYFIGKASSVTVVSRRLPFSSHFGKQPAEKIVKLHESKGVKFLMDSKLDVQEFKSSDHDIKCVGSVVMTDGSILNADLCLVAIGSRPATSFLKDTQLALNKAGYIIVDKYMKTNLDDIYAVGDVVVFPRSCIKLFNDDNKDDLINVPHWQMSHMHGRIAAYSLIDRNIELKSIPFFWTANHGKTVRFAGFNDKYDEIIFHEDPDNKNINKFSAFYLLNNRVVAVASCDWDPICAAVAELMYNDIIISKENILSDPWGIKSLMN